MRTHAYVIKLIKTSLTFIQVAKRYINNKLYLQGLIPNLI